MAVKGDKIEMTIHYTPDLSDVKKEISELSKMNIVIDGKNMKKDLISPLQSSMKEINKAINEGADSKTILKMYESLNRQIEETRKTVNRFNSEMNASYNSEGNKKMLKDLDGLRKEYSKVQKDIDIWDKTFGKERRIQLGITGINDARKQIEDLESRLDSLTDEDKIKLNNLKSFESDWNTKSKSTTKTDLVAEERRLRNLIEELEKSSQSSELNAQWAKNYGNILSRLSSIVSSLTKDMNGLNTAIENQDKAFEEAQKEAKSQATKIGDIFAGTFLGTSVSNMLEDALQRGIEFFKEYDETLTRTMMVTGMTREEVNGLTESYNNLANELSSTTKDVAAAQLVFYQQGLGTKEALAMTEASIAISKTGGIEAAEAADRLTAAVRGYQLAASDAMDIADKMSALDAAAASSVDELTVAMQKSASQAKMAGLDLDYYMAYLSTMQEVTREAPENIGTAMKSITSRIQEITDIGKVEEDGTTFSNVAKALNSIGIAAVDTQGQLRPLQEILNELGPMWATLDRNHQAYIATVLAGNRQQSRFIALMDNYDRALELVNVSQNANGESAKQLRAYNQGLEASFTALSNAWQQFATKLADSDVIKAVVDILTDIVELINKLPDGFTKTILPLTVFMKTFSTLSKITLDFKGFGTWFGEKTGLNKLIKDTKDLGTETQKTASIIEKASTGFTNWFNNLDLNFAKVKKGAEDVVSGMNAIDQSAASAAVTTAQLNVTKAQTAGIVAGEADITEEYGKISKEAGTSVKSIGDAVNANKTAMDNNDVSMAKEIEDTQKLATVSANSKQISRLQSELAKSKADVADYLSNKQYAQETVSMAKANWASSLKGEDLKEYNKWVGAYKRSLRRARKADASGNSLPINEQSMVSEEEYIRKHMPKMDIAFKEYEERLKNSTDILDTSIAFEKKKQKELQGSIDILTGYNKAKQKATEAAIKEAVASEEAANADINEANASNNAANSNNKETTSNIVNGVDMDFWGNGENQTSDKMLGKVNLTNIGKMWDNTEIANMDKVKGTFKELSNGINMTSIASGIMIGSMVDMGAESLGLNKDLSNVLGTFIGLGSALKGFGSTGWIAAAAISVVQFAIDKMFPSVEKMKEELNDLLLKQDELKQKETDISGYLDTYNELSGKLNRTSEETEELNAATQALASTLPDVVTGYDQYGNALIDTTRAMKELQAVQAQQAGTASKILNQYEDLQKGAQNTQKEYTAWSTIIGTLMTIGGIVGTPFTGGASTPLTLAGISTLIGSGASAIEMSVSQKEENKKVIEENYDDIYAQLLTIEGQLVDKMAKEHQGLGDQILKTLAISMLETGRATGEIYVGEIDDMLTEIAGQLNSSTLNKIQNTMNSLEITLGVKEMNYNEAREYVLDRVKDELERAGFEGEGLETVVNIILNTKFDATVEVEEAQKAIQTAIQNSLIGDNDYRLDLDRFGQAIGQLDEDTLVAMRDLGLLDTKFAEVYTNIEDNGFNNNPNIGITEMFRNANGEIDSTIGALRTYEIALRKIKEMEYMQTFDTGTGYADKKMETEKYEIQRAKESGEIDQNATWEDLYGESEVTSLGKWAAEWQRSSEGLVYWKEVADKAYATMDAKLLPTFQEVSDTLKETKEGFDALNNIAEQLDNTNGKLGVNELTGLFDLFSMFEDSATSNADSWNAWMTALQAVNNGISYENGLLKLNEEAMGGVASMVQEATKAKYEKMVADINEAQTSLKLQRNVLKAELDSVSIQIKTLEETGKLKYDEAEFEKNTRKTLADNLSTINMGQVQSEEEKVQKILEINQAGFNQLLAMQKQYENKENASFTLKDYASEYEEAVNKFKKDREDNLVSLITDDYDTTLASLKKYETSLKNQISILDGQILQGDVEKKLFQDIIDGKVDLGKTMSMDGAEDSVADYNEQLEKTLTLLEKIEGLQHTIDENETFKSLYDGYDGESYGRLLISNLKLAQEQYGVYKDLFEMQQEMTNQAAGDLLDSPYGQMFTIAENGDIGWADNTMYDKYKALPEDMQEDIDNLVEAYQEQRDGLRDTEKELSVYAEAVKNAREELIEMEIEVENELLDAIKNREQILHDARIKALEDEIDMIDKAVEARQKAREEQDDADSVYEAQEALRRATLDSSGKNNAQLLQLQQDLEDKQLEISEKRFENDMEDRKNWLQDSIDAEQEAFDYRLENMTWYWEQVQIIQEQGTQAMMETLIMWNEEYRTTSELQQKEMRREWEFNMDAMKKAADMGVELDKLTSDIIDVTKEVEGMNISIEKLPGAWKKATEAANNYSNAANNALKTGNFIHDDKKPDKDTEDKKNPETEINKYIGWVNETVEFDADNTTVSTYNTDGTKAGSAKDAWGSSKNVKVLDSKFINGEWMLLTDAFKGYIPVKYFTTGGFGPFGAKRIWERYATGGIVDYTGPAWVDGTTTKPEAFLSAYQTEKIGALAESISNTNMNSLENNSTINFGSINFNVASMSSSADGKKALETFVQGANDMMAKKGINTKLNLNIK